MQGSKREILKIIQIGMGEGFMVCGGVVVMDPIYRHHHRLFLSLKMISYMEIRFPSFLVLNSQIILPGMFHQKSFLYSQVLVGEGFECI